MVKKNKYLTESGHLRDEYINLYTDALLLDKVKELPSDILDHVEDCNFCKKHILEGYDILKDNEDLKTEIHPFFEKKTGSIQISLIYKIAASIIICISIAGLYLFKFEKESETISERITHKSTLSDSIAKPTVKESKKETITVKKTILPKEKKQENLIAANDFSGKEYQIPPVMISLLGSQIRSDFFEVKYPKDSTIFENKQIINFLWESDIEDNLKLIILNYKDELKFESSEIRTNSLEVEGEFDPGAYIWKIESADEMHHIGLFFVIN